MACLILDHPMPHTTGLQLARDCADVDLSWSSIKPVCPPPRATATQIKANRERILG